MSDDFTFDDETKGVLDKKASNKKASRGSAKQSEKKDQRVQCYLTKSEFQKLEKLLDGRPASVYFRKLLLEQLDS